jgi:hypothetical protein
MTVTMRPMKGLAVLIALASCSKSAAKSATPELDHFDDQLGEPYTGAYATGSAIYMNHKPLAAGGLRAALSGSDPTIVVDFDASPLARARAFVHEVDGASVRIAHRSEKSRDGTDDDCTLTFTTKAIAKEATISIDLQAEHAFVGHTPANEFWDIPNRGEDLDWDRLEQTLREMKHADLFAERADIELAVDDRYKSGAVVRAALIACRTGFTEIAFIPHDQLTAKTIPIPVVDFAGLATAADVIAKLRTQEGKDYFDARAGKDEICGSMRVVASVKHPHKPKPGTGYFVARVHANGGAWIAMVQSFDPTDPTTEFKTKHLEAEPVALRGELNNMRLFTNVKEAPLELAADDRVDGKTFLAAIQAACEGRTQDFDLRRPGELSIVPGQP